MISIDLDTKNQLQLLKTYFNLLYVVKDKGKIIVEESSRGYHVIAYGVKHDLNLRMIFGDDSFRIEADMFRPKYTRNVVFKVKNGRINVDEIEVLSLPFCSKLYIKNKYYPRNNKKKRK